MKNTYIIYICAALAFLPLSAVPAAAQSLSLEDCLRMASENDRYLRNARLDTRAAQLRKQEAFCEYFPAVSLNAMGFHAVNPLLRIGVGDVLGNSDAANNIKNYVNTVAPMYGIKPVYETLQFGYGATLGLTQPIYAGGRIVNGNRLARLGIEAARLQEGLQEKKTALEVEKKYWQLLSLQEKSQTLDRAMELLDTLSRDLTSLRAAGIVTDSELQQLRLKQGELRKDRLKLKGGMRLAKMDLFNAIGLQYSCTGAGATASDGTPLPFIDDIRVDSLPDRLEAPRTYFIPEEQQARATGEARLLELQLSAKELEKKMILGESLPTIGLGASAGYGRYVGDGSFNGIVYAMLKVPISDWGKNSRKLQRQETEVLKARNEKEYLDAQLILRSRQLWLELELAWEQLLLSEENVAFVGDELSRCQSSFEAGLVTLSELMQAQTALRQAQDSLTDDRIAYRTAIAEYLSYSSGMP